MDTLSKACGYKITLHLQFYFFCTTTMKFEGKKLEIPEKEPPSNTVILDVLRHGTTDYLEQETYFDKKKKRTKDLTPKGEEEIRMAAEEITSRINPENELVVLWSSPAWRAEDSLSIVRKALQEKSIEVYDSSSISALRAFDWRDKDYVNKMWERIENPEVAYSRDQEFQESNEKFESQPEVRERARTVTDFMIYLAKNAKLKGKKLHIICVSHFEFINPLMEEVFGYKVEEGKGLEKGEVLRFQFDFDKEGKKLEISADFRGDHKEKIGYDEQQRKFILDN